MIAVQYVQLIIGIAMYMQDLSFFFFKKLIL
jgi:hypothetical protein